MIDLLASGRARCALRSISVVHRVSRKTVALLTVLALCFCCQSRAQTAFLDFNTTAQFTNNFSRWNDSNGVNGGNYAFMEAGGAGVGASRGVSVFQNTDTTATYNSGSWDFSTNGAAIIICVMIKANGQTSTNKIQVGLLNSHTNGLNDNAGVAFESFRFLPSATTWSVRECYRTGNTTTEFLLGNARYIVGHWYKFVVGLTNTSGSTGDLSTSCALYDYGADGLTPGTNIVTFSTLRNEVGLAIAKTNVTWPALRAFQNAGIDAWDNFLVYTPSSLPVFTLGLTNLTVSQGTVVNFAALADGPGTISYTWYTNGSPIAGVSTNIYTSPPLAGGYTNIMVVAANANGATTNSATLTVIVPQLASVTNLPATNLRTNSATLNGQVLATGGGVPTVAFYYGPFDGRSNSVAWSNTVPLGLQNGILSSNITGLAANSNYYFTVQAVNAAGTAWASPSGTFTTPATNAVASNVVAVLTYHNDVARTGQNTNETILTLGNVNTNSFGLIFSCPVDDWVYAQPLVMTNVNLLARGIHNIVIVATVNNTVYAFDADDPSVASPYWQTSFLGPNVVAPLNTDMTGACGGNYQDFHGHMGIVGTPVIDPTTATLYVVAKTKENGSTFVQRLYALDLATGAERPGSPVVISATYPGSGDGSVGGAINFDPMKENQRPALALVNGIVYIGWSSHCDWGPYHGWLIGYNAQTLAQSAKWMTTPNGGLGGIWSSGDAPAVDTAGNLYFETGNGTFSPASGDYGDSFLKVATTNGLTFVDYFTPFDQASLDSADLDIASGGAMLLPDYIGSTAHPHLLVGGSKAGKIYLLDRDNLGHFNASGDSQIVQSVTNATGKCYDTPALFKNTLYMAGTGDPLKAFTISNATVTPTPSSQSATTYGFSAPTVSISANGTSNAIAWALQVDGWASGQPAILHAYNATNLALELYNSSQAASRDLPGGAVKFTVPTVANGKVYVGSQYSLAVFGNASVWLPAPVFSPPGGTFTTPVSVSLSDTTPGASIYYTLDGSTPTQNSALYTGPFQLTNSVGVRARAFKSGAVASTVATATFINSSAIGTGTGLLGAYYSNHFSTNAYSGSPTLVRTDAVVNFNWVSGSPAGSISSDYFTVRWTGSVQPQFNETYTFYTTTDDGVRLWVNGQLLIDHWVNQGSTEWSGSINLLAQQRYNIEMDYFENTGSAVATLSWSSPSTTKAVIPQTQLYPVSNQPPVVSLTSPTNGSVFTAAASVSLVANASDVDDSVARVDFYSNGSLVGTLTNTPFTLTVNGLGASSYNLTAVATDSAGYASTSGPVNITVVAGTGAPYGLTGRSTVSAFLNMPPSAGGTIPPKISQTGVFANTAGLSPASGLLPYTVLVPFWADGTLKTRWFAVPNNGSPFTPGEQIAFAPTGEWTFPAGTVFVQHFDLVTDETKPGVTRRLETRLLVCDTNNAVYGVTYKWRPDNSDADLLTAAVYEDIAITNSVGVRTQTWYYPAPADCLDCHQPAANYVLGVKTRQLNGNFTYASSGVTDNQLRTFNRLGLFYPAFNETNIAGYTHLELLTNAAVSIESRARSYLDASCAQCHRPGGTGPTFDARYDTPLTNQNLINAPVQNGDLGYDNAKIIVPKDIWRSIVYERMNNADIDLRMPDMAGTLVDTNDVQLMVNWINSLSGTPALAPPTLVPAGGLFLGSVSIAIQHPDTNATLRYTLNGTLPSSSSQLYIGPFVLTTNATVTAKAFETGLNDSVAASGLFSIRPPVQFNSGGLFASNEFELSLSGLAGKSYVLQASTNLVDWITLSTNVAPNSPFFLFDPAATNFPARFYRAFELP